MNLVSSDLLPILYLLPFAAAVLGLGFYLELGRGRMITRLLEPHEWLFLGKLLAIGALCLVLAIGKIALDFPAENFLYGRF